MPTITGLAHVTFHVHDLRDTVAHFRDRYGFTTGPVEEDASSRSTLLTQGHTRFLLTQGLTDDHPAAAYVLAHGDGVADMALRVADTEAAFADAVAHGARPILRPTRGASGTTATIGGFGDVVHTLVETPEPAAGPVADDTGLQQVDHFAVCVPAGELDATVLFYQRVLGFEHTFTERIEVGAQAMNSKVVQNPLGGVTLTILEPDDSRTPGQIDTFLKDHGGAGVQHVALRTEDAVRTVRNLRGRGVDFLSTPAAYYEALPGRVTPRGHSTAELSAQDLLIDEDHSGQLFQIFTRSTHPRRTLFFEVIERIGARSFGTANIKALYEAVQRDLDHS